MMKHYFLMLAMSFAGTLAMGQDVAAYLVAASMIAVDKIIGDGIKGDN